MKRLCVVIAVLSISFSANLISAQANQKISPAKWKFEESTDEMDGKKTQSLSQQSYRPTTDSHRPELSVICNNKRQGLPSVAIHEAGLIDADVEGWLKIRYKFEDSIVHEAEWKWMPSVSAMVSMDAPMQFFKEMLHHKTLLIEFRIVRGGKQLAEYDLSDFSEAAKKLTFCSASK